MRDTLDLPDLTSLPLPGQDDPGARSAPLSTSVRAVSAERTLAAIRPMLATFGVRQVIDITLPGVPSCPVFQVLRADMRSDYFNAGKGFSRIESLVSGLMEAIEVQCFERADPMLLTARAALSADAPLLSAAQLGCDYAAAQDDLVSGTDHRDNGRVWLPAETVWRELPGVRLTPASCNGIASGNTVDEALCHALCEMAERHALDRFYREGTRLPLERVMPPTDVPVIARCLGELRDQDIDAEFLLISSAGIAVFICFLDVPLADGRRGMTQGYGAHIDPVIAMCRALGEAVQLLALCPDTRTATSPAAAPAAGPRVVMTSKQSALMAPEVIQRQRVADHALFTVLRTRVEAIDYEYSAVHDMRAAGAALATPGATLQHILASLDAMGYPQVYSCVISPPSLPVVVVKCFCPGLQCIPGL